MRYAAVFFCLMTWVLSSAAQANTFVFMNTTAPAGDASEHFVSSAPYANQTLATAPDAIIITFSAPILPDKSSIKVYDLYGTQLGDGVTTVNGVAMSATLPPLPPGRYAVKWKARCLCADSDSMSDEFHFTVR